MAAIAGIAESYESRTLDASVLGLWKSSLWYDLSWQLNTRRPFPRDDRLNTRLPDLPTWTWLSIRPGIAVEPSINLDRHKMDGLTSRVELLLWDIKWAHEPYTSKILSSELIVEGLTKTANLPEPRGGNPLRLDFEAEWDDFLCASIYLDRVLDKSERDDILLLLLFQDTLYEHALVLKHHVGESYIRLGCGGVSRPRGRKGLFNGAERRRLTLVRMPSSTNYLLRDEDDNGNGESRSRARQFCSPSAL